MKRWFYQAKEFTLGLLVAFGLIFVAKEGTQVFSPNTTAQVVKNTKVVAAKAQKEVKEINQLTKENTVKVQKQVQENFAALQEEMKPAVVKTKEVAKKVKNQITFHKPKPNTISVVSQ